MDFLCIHDPSVYRNCSFTYLAMDLPCIQEDRGPLATRKDRLFCSHCNLPGHSLERCFKINQHFLVCSHCTIYKDTHTKEKSYKLNGVLSRHKIDPRLLQINHLLYRGRLTVDHGPSITWEQYEQLLALLSASQGRTTTPAAYQPCANRCLTHVQYCVM